jgi:hypothetical protein
VKERDFSRYRSKRSILGRREACSIPRGIVLVGCGAEIVLNFLMLMPGVETFVDYGELRRFLAVQKERFCR